MLGILERIRTKKKEITQTTADAYFALVRDVAGGSEVDIESAALIIESANKDDAAFERDVETQQARIGLAIQLKHKQALEKQMPKLEQAERLAGEHYERVVTEASSRLNEAKRAKRALESELLALSYVEGKLSETCLDETLLAREAELTSKRMALVQKRRPLDEDYRHSTALVSASHARIAGIESQIERTSNNKLAQSAYRKDLAKAEQSLAHEQSVGKQLEIVIGKINDELEPLDQELATIRQRKLEV
jgi:molybdopterin converting factor small subunit